MAINFIKKVQIKAQVKTQIKTQVKAQIKTLLFNKTPTTILVEYSNYSNVFIIENISKFPKYFGINNYAIKLEKNKHLFFEFILS